MKQDYLDRKARWALLDPKERPAPLARRDRLVRKGHQAKRVKSDRPVHKDPQDQLLL